MQAQIEILNLVHTSLKHLVEETGRHYKPEESNNFDTNIPEKGIYRINENNTSFEFSITEGVDGTKLKYTFKVLINKVEKLKSKCFFSSKVIDCSRYITRIKITQNTNWSNSEVETYHFDTEYEKHESSRDIQMKIFNLLMDNHLKIEKEKEYKRINEFITEIKKAADKSTIRDEKIDDILT